jgi:hypothetical protein
MGLYSQRVLAFQPLQQILEAGLAELIGINEDVDQNQLCASVAVDLVAECSGEIVALCLYATEDGTGAIKQPEGWLYVFAEDPAIASAAVAISAAGRVSLVGQVEIVAADWDADANGASAYEINADGGPLVFFHNTSKLWFAFKITSVCHFNDAAGDDEQLELNVWYRRSS